MLWAIVTPEYPPEPGGVSDYTEIVAQALADAGDEVHVFAPEVPGGRRVRSDVAVHWLPDGFSTRALLDLDAQLRRLPPERQLLVQYVPHGYGWKGMNLPFCLWLARQNNTTVMFHEVAYPWRRGQRKREHVLATVQHLMASIVARSADRVLVSIPQWAPLLQRLGARQTRWLPIPATVPPRVTDASVAQMRQRLLRPGARRLVGHFGTYAPVIADLVRPAIAALAQDSANCFVLLGRGGAEALERWRSGSGFERCAACGDLETGELAEHLAACDLLIQLYPDGASTRRTSLMAGLCIGVPVVTNEGILSEGLWRESGAVALGQSPSQCVELARGLLADDERRRALGARGRQLYDHRFAIENVVRELRVGAQRRLSNEEA